ncbi:MAG: DUF169 domain-containing protein [Thermodesulfobacteriota bacterium]
MTLTKNDFPILNKFNFEVQPVGVKFLVKRPDLVERLDEKMALCEMLKRAQEGNAFFADKENHTCEAGLIWSRAENLRGGAFCKQTVPICTEDRQRCG